MPSSPAFRWSAKTGQYVRANGQFVPRTEVRRAIDKALDAEKARALDLSNALRSGSISLEKWRAEMRDIIKNVHLYSASAASGGWAQLSQADYGRIGQIIRGEYGFLEKFAQGIARGTVPLDGNFLQRALQYAEAGRDSYHQTERASARRAGKREERNILHPADHCGGCLGESARGWVKIGQLIPIGRRICRRKCRCSLRFR